MTDSNLVKLVLHEAVEIDGRKHVLLDISKDGDTGKLVATIWRESSTGPLTETQQHVSKRDLTEALRNLHIEKDDDSTADSSSFHTTSDATSSTYVSIDTRQHGTGPSGVDITELDEDERKWHPRLENVRMRCHCGLPAVVWTCNRDYNGNKGRIVAACGYRKCGFFKFQTPPLEDKHAIKVGSILCHCGAPTRPQRAFSSHFGREGHIFCQCFTGECNYFVWVKHDSVGHKRLLEAFESRLSAKKM
jgi:hypothetical protein